MNTRKPQAPEAEEGGFFSRWSRRKVEAQQGNKAEVSSPPVLPSAEAARGAAPPAVQPTVQSTAPPTFQPTVPPTAQPGASTRTEPIASRQAEPLAPPKRLTLDDVEKLGADADFSPFTRREVDPEVRNAALRKLFHSDPHFNVMDGLDVYIDDYNTPNPLPKAVMKTMLQARVLGLLDDELKEQEHPVMDQPVQRQAQDMAPQPVPAPEVVAVEVEVPVQAVPEAANESLQHAPRGNDGVQPYTAESTSPFELQPNPNGVSTPRH